MLPLPFLLLLFLQVWMSEVFTTVYHTTWFLVIIVISHVQIYFSDYMKFVRSIDKVYLAGIIYDVIVEPPSVGSTTDEFGHSKPVSFSWHKDTE